VVDRSISSRWERVNVRWPSLIPLLVITAAVICANLPVLLHLVTANPLVLNANLASPSQALLPGVPYADPNAGWTTQALGHLAALDWLHGHIPWWNPFEGVGSPLAGEMQSGAFFPLTILLAFHNGLLFMQLALEALTGWSTYFLVRRLGVGRTFSTAAGVAFGLCGTYAWFAHAPIRPIVFLPLCLVGVERAVDAAQAERRGGWHLLAVAIALSILAGFPETAFIDAVFVAWWSLLRLAGPGRQWWRRIVAKLASGIVIGIGLSAPLVVAFADYLKYADDAGHNGSLAYRTLSPQGLVQLLLPYSLGPVSAVHWLTPSSRSISLLWGNVGGYLTVGLVACALVGLVGNRQRILRIGLGAWVLVCLLRVYGFSPVVHLLAAVPGIRLTAFYRYSQPSWELAVIVLAGLGLDDLARNATRRRTFVAGATVTGLLAVWAAATAWSLLRGATAPPGHRGVDAAPYVLGSVAFAGITLGLLATAAWLAGRSSGSGGPGRLQQRERSERSRRRGRILMAGVVGAESVLLFGFTYLSAPTPTALQTGSVTWLQHHLGNSRFATLGPIQPDYGSYFGIADASMTDVPTPKAWDAYFASRLDTTATPVLTPAQELTAHLPNFEALGVRFIVESADGRDPNGNPWPALRSPPWPAGPRLVYHDSFAEIWQLPSAAPLFSFAGEGTGQHSQKSGLCTVTGEGWDQATVRCSHPSLLIRRVLYLPGWSADEHGASVPVTADRGGPAHLFQNVPLPAGTTTVHFTYLPPHELPAIVIAVLLVVLLVGSLVWAIAQRSADRSRAPDTQRGTR
jgi:hypothetical protein